MKCDRKNSQSFDMGVQIIQWKQMDEGGCTWRGVREGFPEEGNLEQDPVDA